MQPLFLSLLMLFFLLFPDTGEARTRKGQEVRLEQSQSNDKIKLSKIDDELIEETDEAGNTENVVLFKDTRLVNTILARVWQFEISDVFRPGFHLGGLRLEGRSGNTRFTSIAPYVALELSFGDLIELNFGAEHAWLEDVIITSKSRHGRRFHRTTGIYTGLYATGGINISFGRNGPSIKAYVNIEKTGEVNVANEQVDTFSSKFVGGGVILRFQFK